MLQSKSNEVSNLLAYNLKIVRSITCCTQQEIADYLHINRTTYTYYERGKTQPSYDTLKAIIDFYNFEIEIEPKLSFDDLLVRKINNKYLKLKEVKLWVMIGIY